MTFLVAAVVGYVAGYFHGYGVAEIAQQRLLSRSIREVRETNKVLSKGIEAAWARHLREGRS